MNSYLASKVLDIHTFLLNHNQILQELNLELAKAKTDIINLKYEIEVLKSRNK